MYPRLKFFSLIIVTLILSLLFSRQIGEIAVDSSAKQPQKCGLPNKDCQNIPNSVSLAIAQSMRWQEFSPPDGGFSILMPGKPIEQRKAGNLENGSNDLHLFLLFIEEKSMAYGVSYREFPDDYIQLSASQINQKLNYFRDEFVNNDRLRNERNIRLDGYLGREIEVENSQGFVSKIRIYLVGKRLYQLVVGSATKTAFPKEADTFLDSFKLLAIKVMQRQYASSSSPIAQNRAQEAERLYQEGFKQYQQGRFPEALETLQQALAIFRDLGDRQGEAAMLTRIGRVYDSLKQDDLALEVYDRALKIAREIGNRQAEGITLDYIGRVYEKLGQYPKALELQQQALGIFKEIKNRRSEGIILANLGSLYRKIKQDERALEIYQQALIINREIGERQGEGVTLDYIGVAYNNLGQYQKGLESHQQALAIFQEIGNRRSQAIVLNNIGLVYRNLNQTNQAIEFLEKALEIFREIDDKAGIETTLRQLENLRQKQ